MKKYLLLAIVITVFTNSYSKSKDYKHTLIPSRSHQDTAKYLYEHVVLQKAKFQHKELNEILNGLNIEVKSYLINFGRKVGYCKGITLFVETSKDISEKLDKHINPPGIYVEFEKPIPLALITPTLNISHGEWLAGEKELYGKQIIIDIKGNKP